MGRNSSYGGFSVVLLLLALLNQQLPIIASQPQQTSLNPTECLYPCLPPPTIIPDTNCPPPPPPSQPSMQPPPISEPPPSDIYPPSEGGYTPYFPPSWYQNNAPPPPDPILPYFPWYYKHPLFDPHSSASGAQLLDFGFMIRVLGFLCSALFL